MILVTYSCIMAYDYLWYHKTNNYKIVIYIFCTQIQKAFRNLKIIKNMRLFWFRIMLSLLYWYVERLTETHQMVLRMLNSMLINVGKKNLLYLNYVTILNPQILSIQEKLPMCRFFVFMSI